jgi:hypothetical protein
MVPRSAIDVCFETIFKARTRSNGTLADTWNTIHPRCLLLKKSMPMYCCTFFSSSGDVVVDPDWKLVSKLSSY